jgi:hypothetical protein
MSPAAMEQAQWPELALPPPQQPLPVPQLLSQEQGPEPPAPTKLYICYTVVMLMSAVMLHHANLASDPPGRVASLTLMMLGMVQLVWAYYSHAMHWRADPPDSADRVAQGYAAVAIIFAVAMSLFRYKREAEALCIGFITGIEFACLLFN